MMSDKLSYKFSICRLIAVAGVVFLISRAVFLEEDAAFYVHIPSFVFPFGVCFFLMLGSYGTDFLRFIPASQQSLVCKPSRPDARYAEIAKSGSRYIIAAGVLSGLMGSIPMLQNISDPSMLGMGLAVTMLPIFYAILASELFFALVYKAFSSSNSSSEPNGPVTNPLPMSNILIPVIVFGFMIGMVFILLQSFSTSWY